jgi:hypothetical protein
VPLEDQAATTNNLGLGTPFAGNLEVYPLYRIEFVSGVQEAAGSEVRKTQLPTIIRGVLFLPAFSIGRLASSVLLDLSGRKVMDLVPGANNVRRLSSGVYFVQLTSNGFTGVQKFVVQR